MHTSRRGLFCSSTPIRKDRCTLWRHLRKRDDLPLKTAQRGIADIVKAAKRDGTEWVFIDTAPNMSASVTEAIRAATLVIIPCRPGLFDLEAIKDTVEYAREARKPYAVVINAAPPRRQDVEAPAVAHARKTLAELHIPVWGGQITQRAAFSLALEEGEAPKNTTPIPTPPPKSAGCGPRSRNPSKPSTAPRKAARCTASRRGAIFIRPHEVRGRDHPALAGVEEQVRGGAEITNVRRRKPTVLSSRCHRSSSKMPVTEIIVSH